MIERFNLQAQAMIQIEDARRARSRWMAGLISDQSLISQLDSCRYASVQSAGLSHVFDQIADVNCAREWLKQSKVYGDEPAVVRSYAMHEWIRLSAGGESGATDYFNVLVPYDAV